MPFDFSKLKPAEKKPQPIDPIELFQRLRVTDSSINDLWLAQGDALREWHKNRTEPDISIALNTGAGKTLLGLLVGQSLVNETKGLILYACSSLQLVEQTEKKAIGYGLPITTYAKGQYSNDLSTQGEAVCLTTYQALFNGKSIFASQEIAAIVFDDAHAAEHLLRDHFSLRIRKDKLQGIFDSICAEFSDYFHGVGRAVSFDEVRKGDGNKLLLVPPFELAKSYAQILSLLKSSSIPGDTDTTFAWQHLKDHIDLCSLIISPSEIVFTPPFVPVRTLPYFRGEIRRVYLSATLSAPDVFIRTFGRQPSIKISPNTTAGECERMILVPAKMSGVVQDVNSVIDFADPFKMLILVPSYARSSVWAKVAQPPQRESATNAIESFKTAKGNPKLLLTARYDGMDLPGDMCRVVTIDDLPSGTGHLERYLWEYLGLSATLRTTVASRIVQSFGRISRGMSDHGVAIITGKRLIDWLLVPKNIASLPHFLQKQLELGFQMSSNMKAEDASPNINACLNRETDWIQAYENFMRDAEHSQMSTTPEVVAELALAETHFAEEMWDREYAKAAKRLTTSFDKAADFSVNCVCWHKLWAGYAQELAGDIHTARVLYQQAHGGQKNIPAYYDRSVAPDPVALPEQIIAASRLFEISSEGRVLIPRSLESDLLHLDGSGTTAQTEEALRCLGQYLGFESSRPDKEHGTGPDVLWKISEDTALCMDAKTDKQSGSAYRKSELGQLSDHVQWVRDNYQCENIIPCLVGPENPASDVSNPQDGVKVAALGKFNSVADTLKTAYRNCARTALPLTIEHVVNEEFEKRSLAWDQLNKNLELLELRDLG
ncbi:MAG: DEAD/DEAH box helicase family protein [Candidatus Hydrogenedentes bacterium]|nr:DEAD/DEAH box helicase family protein [Candidatus Hydrogenedentota bacterium]